MASSGTFGDTGRGNFRGPGLFSMDTSLFKDIPLSETWDLQFRFVVFKDEKWDWRTFDFDKDIERTIQADDGQTDARNPDIKPFLAHNGKLLLYHGWSDPQITPYNSIDFFHKVLAALQPASAVAVHAA